MSWMKETTTYWLNLLMNLSLSLENPKNALLTLLLFDAYFISTCFVGPPAIQDLMASDLSTWRSLLLARLLASYFLLLLSTSEIAFSPKLRSPLLQDHLKSQQVEQLLRGLNLENKSSINSSPTSMSVARASLGRSSESWSHPLMTMRLNSSSKSSDSFWSATCPRTISAQVLASLSYLRASSSLSTLASKKLCETPLNRLLTIRQELNFTKTLPLWSKSKSLLTNSCGSAAWMNYATTTRWVECGSSWRISSPV